MTLINLFRRYERWNPVHPTYGAFWGIGFGLGCGVGWGPGFGPEVIGYVGSGCGVGVSVGVTMVGIGVGLPAGGLAAVPCDVVSYAGHSFFDFTKSSAAPALSRAAKQGWKTLSFHALDIGTKLRRVSGCNSETCQIDASREWERVMFVATGTLKQRWDCLNEKIREAGLCHLQRGSIPRLRPATNNPIEGTDNPT